MVEPLEKAIEAASRLAVRFYRAGKGMGTEQVDMSAFFKSKRSSLRSFTGYLNSNAFTVSGVDKNIERIAKSIA